MATTASEFRRLRDGLARQMGFQPESGASGRMSHERWRVSLAVVSVLLISTALVGGLLMDAGRPPHKALAVAHRSSSPGGLPPGVPPGVSPAAPPAASPSVSVSPGVSPGISGISPAEDAFLAAASPAASWLAPGLPDVERVIWRPGTAGSPATPDRGKVVELSFDDGPNPVWTPQVLSVLKAEGVHATFSLIGYEAQRYSAIARQELADGDAVCDHTAHHNEHLDLAPPDVVAMEIDLGADMIRSATGADPTCYRPPANALSPLVIDTAHQRRMRVLGYSVDPSDYRRPSAAILLRRVLTRVKPGSVILLHDGGGDRSQTVAMLKVLIDNLKAQGYRFTTIVDEPVG